jgi:hypothetical protein
MTTSACKIHLGFITTTARYVRVRTLYRQRGVEFFPMGMASALMIDVPRTLRRLLPMNAMGSRLGLST